MDYNFVRYHDLGVHRQNRRAGYIRKRISEGISFVLHTADVESVHELKGFRIILGLFSVSGFEDELYHSDAVLIDKGEVVHNPINGMKTA